MIEIYDIELLENKDTKERFFSYTGVDRDSDLLYQFYIHDSLEKLESFKQHLRSLGGMVGYNNLNYDYPILHLILTTKFKSLDHFFTILLEKSHSIIEGNQFSRIWDSNIIIPQLDLFLIWHFNNKAKRTSLKDCQMAMRWWNLQSFEFDKFKNEEDIQSILDYNKNDTLSTKKLYLITKGITEEPLYKGDDKIQLRNNISKQYGIKCLNYNDVKIGDEINKKIYLSLTGKTWNDIKDLNTKRPIINIEDVILPLISFKSKKLNDILEWFKSKKIIGTKGQIEKMFTFHNVKFKVAQGGIHSIDSPELITPLEDEVILDFDIDSEYPTNIILSGLYPEHLGPKWLEGYTKTYWERIEAKKRRKEHISFETINKTFKLSLNGGGYGKTNEPTSWQYDPLVAMSVTINCQLLILMFCELFYYNEIEILSANTDGVTVKVKKDKVQLTRDLVNDFSKKTKYTFEENEYKFIARTSINDYLALKGDNSIKVKGDFEINKEIHKNHSNRLRSIAILNYFINKVPVEETVKNHYYGKCYNFGKDTIISYGIFDYCLYVKGGSDWVLHYYEKLDKENVFSADKVYKLPKNVRYFISNKGGELHKIKRNDGQDNKVNVGYLINVANIIQDNNPLNYDINYQFYINECKKMIDSIEIKPIISRTSKKRVDNSVVQLKLF